MDPCGVPQELDRLFGRCAELGAALDARDNRRLAALLARPDASSRPLDDLIDDIGPLAADCHRALVRALES